MVMLSVLNNPVLTLQLGILGKLLGVMGRIVKGCVREVSLAQVSCILMYVYVAPPTPAGAWPMALGYDGVLSIIFVLYKTSGAGLCESNRDRNLYELGARPLANNSVIVSGSEGLRVQCVSNSSLPGVGNITILNGSSLSYGDTDVWNITNPHNYPGFVGIENHWQSIITSEHQGVYTCTIPDSNGNEFVFNFGLYPNGFTGKRKPNTIGVL